MSNTIYLDINAKNSKLEGDDNNVLQYELPEELSLPTGTQVKCLQSIVNQQGTVGSSIVLDTDVNEKIVVQFYIVDTTYPYPTPSLAIGQPGSGTDPTTNWQLFQELSVAYNSEFTYGDPNVGMGLQPFGTFKSNGTDPGTAKNITCGGFEIVLPLVQCCEMSDSGDGVVTREQQYFVPFTGVIEIEVKKGTYNVNKLAEIITDQINGIEIPNFNDLNSSDVQKVNETYSGYNTNNTTLRKITIVNENGITAFYNDRNAAPAQFEPFRNNGEPGPDQYIQPPAPIPTVRDAKFGFSCIGVSPSFSSAIRKSAIQGYVGTNVPEDYRVNIVMPNDNGSATNPSFYRAFEIPYQTGSIADAIQEGFLQYNPFTSGLAVGSTGFELKVNDDGEFQFDYTHTPRYIPTYDTFGNKQDNPGQECAYIKRVCGTPNPDREDEFPTGRTAPVRTFNRSWVRSYSQPMKRTSGFMVLNWAYQTCINESGGTPPPIEGQRDDLLGGILPNVVTEMNGNRLFDEWFDSDARRREVWEKTIWYKLGFTYDDIQNPSNFERQYFPDDDDVDKQDFATLEGFTTNERLDASALTTSSTLVNGQGHTASGTFSPKGGINPVAGSISGIQAFNTMDVNVPYDVYNNNAAESTTFGSTTGAYKGSFYYGATMVPVITTGIPVSASRLPVFSNNGYMMVTSDLVEPTDIVKKNTFAGLLDIIPNSNLNNADFIADRNVLTHTISNPQVVKEITIKITNPDLTNIRLEPNSAFLLAITLPQPKQTVMLADLEYTSQEQQVASSIQQLTAEGIKNGTIPDFPTLQTYTVQPEPVSADQAREQPQSASRRRIELAKRAVAYSKLKTDEQKANFLSRIPEGDRDDVLRAARNIGRQPDPRGGGGGGTASDPRASDIARRATGRPPLTEREVRRGEIFRGIQERLRRENPGQSFRDRNIEAARLAEEQIQREERGRE